MQRLAIGNGRYSSYIHRQRDSAERPGIAAQRRSTDHRAQRGQIEFGQVAVDERGQPFDRGIEQPRHPQPNPAADQEPVRRKRDDQRRQQLGKIGGDVITARIVWRGIMDAAVEPCGERGAAKQPLDAVAVK